MNSEERNQTEVLADALPASGGPANTTAPRMPFQTALVLTREQEDGVVAHFSQRLDDIEKQMGRQVDAAAASTSAGGSRSWGGGWGAFDETTWMGKRQMYTMRYYSHVGDREFQEGGDTVYKESNHTLNESQRIVMQMVARLKKFFFGEPDDTDWFSTDAVGAEDDNLADTIKKHSRWKCDQCKVKPNMGDGIEYAAVRGEAVLKATHKKRRQIYKRKASILVDAQKQPILSQHGDYIVQGDAWVQEMSIPAAPGGYVPQVGGSPEEVETSNVQLPTSNVEQGNPAATVTPPPNDLTSIPSAPESPGAASVPPAPAAPAGPVVLPQPVPTGRMLLKKDGVTVEPAVPIYDTQVITRELVTFEGPDCPVVFYKDFLCAIDAPDIQTADVIAHLYDMSVMQVAEMFQSQYGQGDSGIADLTAAIDLLRDMLGESSQPKAAANQPRGDFGETMTEGAQGSALSEIAECYGTYDVDGDGVMEEIMLVLDRKKKAPIYYEYTANVTVRGDRPFYVFRPIKVDGRWWGMGFMEFFSPEQNFIDLQINRHNFNTSSAGRVTIWRPHLTIEGDLNGDLKLNMGRTYTPKNDSVKNEEIVSFIQLPSDAENLEYLLNLFMQAMQLKSGVINGADQAQAGLPTPDTATGVNEIHDSGQELFSHFVGNMYFTAKDILQANIDLIYANLNREEVFNYFNGEENEILALTPDDVRDLALNVTLVLSKSQERKALQIGQQADQSVDTFYQRPYPIQQRTAQFTRQRLKALGISQSDKVIDPIDPALMAPQGQPGQPGQPTNVTQMPAV